MERVPLKQTDRHHKSPGGDLCIRDSSPKGRGDRSNSYLTLSTIKKGAFAPLLGYDFLINSHRLIKKKLALGNSAPMIGGMP